MLDLSLQSDWATTIVAAKINPDIGLKPDLPSGMVEPRPTSIHLHNKCCYDYVKIFTLCTMAISILT